MFKRVLHIVVLLSIITTLAALPRRSAAQANAQYFPETGHWVSGYFLHTWQNTPNATFVLGLPISRPFQEESLTEPGTFYTVQYFERAVLEEHPENYGISDNQYYILARLMGSIMAEGREQEAPFQPVADTADGTWIDATQHTLTNDPAPFRTFWEQNGGLDVFGYPISEQFQEVNQANGEVYWVQYFERQRMEWHPESEDPRYEVMLGLMGSEYRDSFYPNNPAFEPEAGDTPPVASDTPPVASDTPPADTDTDTGTDTPPADTDTDTGTDTPPADTDTDTDTATDTPPADTTPPTSNTPWRDEFPPMPAPDDSFIYGYNAMLYHNGEPWQNRQRVLDMAKGSGVYWIRQQIAWKDIQDVSGVIHWGELDDIVEDVHNADMKLMLSVVQSPWWATSNGSHGLPTREHFATFADFLGQMAARYKGKVQAYEVWNEQNRACENGGDCQTAGGIGGQVASADYYVDMLYEVYNAIKANDPDAIVVSGAPTSTETNHPDIAMSDITYIKNMLSNPNFRADVVGMHPGGQNNPPDAMWPDNPGPEPWSTSREFYFRRIEDVRQAMVDAGRGDMKLWVTEFGWATPNVTPGYEYGNSISFETQAEWVVRAFEIGRHEYSPWVGGMFLWQLNFAVPWTALGEPLHEQASFGVLNGDWTPRPAWYAIRDMPK